MQEQQIVFIIIITHYLLICQVNKLWTDTIFISEHMFKSSKTTYIWRYHMVKFANSFKKTGKLI